MLQTDVRRFTDRNRVECLDKRENTSALTRAFVWNLIQRRFSYCYMRRDVFFSKKSCQRKMRSKHPTLQTVYIKTGARLDYEYTTSKKKKRKNHYFMRNRTGNRQERFMFVLFCFVLFCFVLFWFCFFLRSACWEFIHKKRGKIENWNGLIHLCWLAEGWPQQVKFNDH